ncbi:MAG: GNAT family N-acetyltransferase [Candidatus Marinimicrobia bacterium]|nr:GNAT family N-acetyltransferase [Candidatus Neomarinimicrobiota bacterium]MDD9888013.1 GNAT family N-acetyltransferase [Candidatus Neomarinimicrobiota bacterium]MDD9931730.1 GNAT family N-acetyltransferase [Candidatus Neomarinimicrobiota bacterium]
MSEIYQMNVKVKNVKTSAEKSSVISIRKDVFIKGMNIPKSLEIDDNEDDAHYVLAYLGNTPVGTARWRRTDEGIKFERFAVLDGFRLLGIGRKMTKFILSQIPKGEHIYLNSQNTAIEFYKNIGFKSVGPMFEEVGIPHQKMIYIRGE